MLRAVLFFAIFLSALYCLIDLINSDEHKRGGAPKFLWAVVIILLPLLGPLIWIVFTSGRSGTTPVHPMRGSGRGPVRPAGPRAPDDDPDFLWRLAREQRKNGTGPSAGSPTTSSPSSPNPPQQGPPQSDSSTPMRTTMETSHLTQMTHTAMPPPVTARGIAR